MNIERILKLADYIEYHPEKFDMETWFSDDMLSGQGVKEASELYHTCDTSACIAGHAVAMFMPELNVRSLFNFSGKGAEVLGLAHPGQIEALFRPNRIDDGIIMHKVTNLHAAKCLRHLAKTGEVDWEATKPTRFEIIKNKAICYFLDFFR